MSTPGAHIITLKNPALYTTEQLDLACAVMQAMNRGKLVLTEAPKR